MHGVLLLGCAVELHAAEGHRGQTLDDDIDHHARVCGDDRGARNRLVRHGHRVFGQIQKDVCLVAPAAGQTKTGHVVDVDVRQRARVGHDAWVGIAEMVRGRQLVKDAVAGRRC